MTPNTRSTIPTPMKLSVDSPSSSLLGRDEFDKISPHFDEVRLVEVEHVARFVVGKIDGIPTFARDAVEMINAVLDVCRRGGEISVAALNKEA